MADFRGVAADALSAAPVTADHLARARNGGRILMRGGVRFLFAAALIAGTGILLQARGRNEIFPPRQPLKSFPSDLGPWTGTDVPMEREVLDILGAGDFLLRIYRPQDATQPPVDLFMAYFPTQRTGDTIHSPKHCLPGAGALPV